MPSKAAGAYGRPPRDRYPTRRSREHGPGNLYHADVERSDRATEQAKAGHGYYRPTKGHASPFEETRAERGRRKTPGHPALTRRGRGGYAKIIGAEYIATLLIIFGLFLTGTKKESRPQTIARFSAVSLVFALLALLSGPKTGRVASAFGGLVLLVAVLDATSEIETIAAAFGAGTSKKSKPNIGGAAGIGQLTGSLAPSSGNGGGGGTAMQRAQAI